MVGRVPAVSKETHIGNFRTFVHIMMYYRVYGVRTILLLCVECKVYLNDYISVRMK